MTLLFFLFLLSGLNAWSDGTNIYAVWEGHNITLTCSKCSQSTSYDGLYLYHEEKEVLFFLNNNKNLPVFVRNAYKDRVDTYGSFNKLYVTMRNLTASSKGLYRCLYANSPEKSITCESYELNVTGFTEQKCDKKESTEVCLSVPYMLITVVIPVCLFFLMVIVFILVLQRGFKDKKANEHSDRREKGSAILTLVKQRFNGENTREQNATKGHQSPTEYVYEEMRKNPVYSRIGQPQHPQA